MERDRSLLTLVGTALLGVIAVVAVVTGAFILFGGWVVWRDRGTFDDVATVAAVMTGALTIGLGLIAGFAAHEEWLERPRGRMLGLIVAVVGFLAAIVPLLTGRTDGNEELFAVGAALAAVTALALLVPAQNPASPVAR